MQNLLQLWDWKLHRSHGRRDESSGRRVPRQRVSHIWFVRRKFHPGTHDHEEPKAFHPGTHDFDSNDFDSNDFDSNDCQPNDCQPNDCQPNDCQPNFAALQQCE